MKYLGYTVISSNNAHLQHGGVMLSEDNGNIIFEENSITGFNNNSGSGIFSILNCNVIFRDNSRVTFNNNIAHHYGVLTSAIFSNIMFTDNTKVIYDTNKVSYILSSEYEISASTICTFKRSKIIFTANSLATFIDNKANRGGGGVIVFDGTILHSNIQ